MQVIYKYPLELHDLQTLQLPANAHILTVQLQQLRPSLWAMVDPQRPTTPRIIEIRGTGHETNDDVVRHYLGTFQMSGGSRVFHAFEIVATVKPEQNK